MVFLRIISGVFIFFICFWNNLIDYFFRVSLCFLSLNEFKPIGAN